MKEGEQNTSGNSSTVNDVDNLVQQLRTETENARAVSSSTTESTNNSSEFEEPIDQPTIDIPGEEPAEISARIKKSATRYVKMFNSLMKLIFKPLYKKTILEPDDVEKMRVFRNSHRGKNSNEMEEALHSDDAMWPVANRFDKFMKAVEELPLDADEMEMLSEPLSEVLNKYKKAQLSPEWMLVISTGMIMLPRLAPMMPDLSKMFNDKNGAS